MPSLPHPGAQGPQPQPDPRPQLPALETITWVQTPLRALLRGHLQLADPSPLAPRCPSALGGCRQLHAAGPLGHSAHSHSVSMGARPPPGTPRSHAEGQDSAGVKGRVPHPGWGLETERRGGWGGGLPLPLHFHPCLGRKASEPPPKLWGPPTRRQRLVPPALRGSLPGGAWALPWELPVWRQRGGTQLRPQSDPRPGWTGTCDRPFQEDAPGVLGGGAVCRVDGTPSAERGQHSSL